jgi:cyclase
MRRKAISAKTGLLPALALLAAAGSLYPQGQTDFSKVQIKTAKVSNNLYTLEGQGGTIGALVGPDGVLLVDTQFAPLTEKIAAAVKQISTSPLRFVINTHLHGDHTGGNANFAKMGVTILARDELRAGLARPAPGPSGAPGKPAPPAALPLVTYSGTVTFHMNGEEVQAIPIRAAHTNGDTLVRFVNADVLMTGDFFRSVGYPYVDRANGGTLQGLIDGLGFTIGLTGPNTRIIPGHGPIVDRAGLTAHRDMLLAVRDNVAPLVRQNKTLEEVIAAKPTSDYDARIPNATATSERFIGWLYAELKAAL